MLDFLIVISSLGCALFLIIGIARLIIKKSAKRYFLIALACLIIFLPSAIISGNKIEEEKAQEAKLKKEHEVKVEKKAIPATANVKEEKETAKKEEDQKKSDEQKQTEQKKQEEAKKLEEKKAQEEAQAKAAEEERKQEEANRIAEEKRVAEQKQKEQEALQAKQQAEAEQAKKEAEEKAQQEAQAQQQQQQTQTVYFKNCTEARAAGAAPVHRGDAGYAKHLDRDGDGIGCDQ